MYEQRAEDEKIEHKRLYPDYELKPRKSSDIKKRKSKGKLMLAPIASPSNDAADGSDLSYATSVGYEQLSLSPTEAGFNLDLATDITSDLFHDTISTAEDTLNVSNFNFDVATEATADMIDENQNIAEEATAGLFDAFNEFFESYADLGLSEVNGQA